MNLPGAVGSWMMRRVESESLSQSKESKSKFCPSRSKFEDAMSKSGEMAIRKWAK